MAERFRDGATTAPYWGRVQVHVDSSVVRQSVVCVGGPVMFLAGKRGLDPVCCG